MADAGDAAAPPLKNAYNRLWLTFGRVWEHPLQHGAVNYVLIGCGIPLDK